MPGDDLLTVGRPLPRHVVHRVALGGELEHQRPADGLALGPLLDLADQVLRRPLALGTGVQLGYPGLGCPVVAERAAGAVGRDQVVGVQPVVADGGEARGRLEPDDRLDPRQQVPVPVPGEVGARGQVEG
ncbi:hypothetical protein [Amycolatopsis sp. H20-H5]|uniref:hypothetical protein n=1 Tax=Amycolatopsis sp. H20-H5 TaxID=3046309 RepID=UPI002DBBDFD4|nr:hypothetical protein [Amycolatopsis sp. H20-H5]MEC3981427.1 hypothetical protein [Amycolatopsis sp. H20-H5]